MAGKKPQTLTDFLIPSLKSLGVGLRVGSEIAGGIETGAVGRFNVAQIDREMKQLGVTRAVTARQMERYARRFKGEQQVAVATSGLATEGSMVDLMADTAAQLKLQSIMQERDFEARRVSMQQERALTERQTGAAQRGAYFRAAAQLGEGLYGLLK